MATASMHEAKDKLSESSDKANTVTKAIEAYIGKVKDITVKAKVDDADMEQAINKAHPIKSVAISTQIYQRYMIDFP